MCNVTASIEHIDCVGSQQVAIKFVQFGLNDFASISLLMALVSNCKPVLCHLLSPKRPHACFGNTSMQFMGHKRLPWVTNKFG